MQIDRKDNNGNYCPENCHFITRLENQHNKQLLKSTNTKGFRGIFKHGKHGKYGYAARQQINNKVFNLGTFSDPVSAAINRDWFATQMSDILPLNFPILKKNKTDINAG